MANIALPLSRSLILFMTTIMAFVWRIGGEHDPFSDVVDTCGRTFITGVFMLGMVHLTLVLLTVRTYGRTMDARWQQRVEGWARERRKGVGLSAVPGQTLPSSGVNNCPSQLVPIGAYLPRYMPYTRLPFLSSGNAVNQFQRDLPLWKMVADGAMDQGYTTFIPSQPPGASPDCHIDLQSPNAPSGHPTPWHESQHHHSLPAAGHPFQPDAPHLPSPNTTSMLDTVGEVLPLRIFPAASTPPVSRPPSPYAPPDRIITFNRSPSPNGRSGHPCLVRDQLRTNSVQDYPSDTTLVTCPVQIDTPHLRAMPDIEMGLLHNISYHPSTPALYAPQPLRTGSTWFRFRDPRTDASNHLQTLYEGDFGQVHSTHDAASILGNIGMGYVHPFMAVTRDETRFGNWRSRE
jgi:hypothetical protein